MAHGDVPVFVPQPGTVVANASTATADSNIPQFFPFIF